MRRPLRSICVALLALWGGVALSLESDQFYAWDRDIEDATDVLNAKVELEIDLELERINADGLGQELSCHQVVKRIIPRFKQFIFQDFELWVSNSPLVDRVPATPDEELAFRQVYLYRNTHFLDLGTKVPPSPTIEIAGVRLGTDKLSHFFSEGFMYYRWFRKARSKGASVEDAELRAIRRGISWERTILGLIASGVFSLGDLEANYQGMLFLVGLCESGSTRLEKTTAGWTRVGDFDFRNHVSPDWDESWNAPVYGKRRWKRVRPVVLEYCSMLDDPRVVRRRENYANRERDTLTRREIRRLVESRKLRDPALYEIERNCDDAERDNAPAVEPERWRTSR